MKHQAMQISKAQVQQHKKADIFDLLKVIAIFSAIYIAYKTDNPFVCFGLIVLIFFLIDNLKDNEDDFPKYYSEYDKAKMIGKTPDDYMW
jgi:hypothetical protein